MDLTFVCAFKATKKIVSKLILSEKSDLWIKKSVGEFVGGTSGHNFQHFKFISDGVCEDIDECVDGGNDCTGPATCINTDGKYKLVVYV